jgi:hypothetical protein
VLVRIADASGKSDGARDELPGRPTRDGRLLIAASLADRAAGLVTVRAYDRASGQPAWAQTVKFALPILHVLMLDSDRQGMVYLAAAIGRESEVPPFPIIDERITLVRLGAGGAVRATLDVPPIESPDEVFRPITVGDDGVVYVMVPGKDGLTVYAYRF